MDRSPQASQTGVPHCPAPGRAGLILTSEPPVGQDILGRYMFLEARRYDVPKFWYVIHQFWEAKEPAQLERWMTRNGVVDEWFKGAIWDTLEFWCRNPDSPSTRLEEGYRWFCYREVDQPQFSVPLFSPVFSHPFLKKTAEPAESPEADRFGMVMSTPMAEWPAHRSKLEMVDEFEARVKAEFAAQLREYTGYLRRITATDQPEQQKHAEWTAFAFCGISYMRIASTWPGLRYSRGEQPDKTVAVAVKRFAERIGLTMPKRRKKVTRP